MGYKKQGAKIESGVFVIQKEKRQPGLFSSELQIVSRRNMYGPDPEKTALMQPSQSFRP